MSGESTAGLLVTMRYGLNSITSLYSTFFPFLTLFHSLVTPGWRRYAVRTELRGYRERARHDYRTWMTYIHIPFYYDFSYTGSAGYLEGD